VAGGPAIGFRRPRDGGPCQPFSARNDGCIAAASSANETGAVEAPASSAYPGCGQAIPASKLWDETTESEVQGAISAAKTCAARNNRHVLLEFVAPWCDDCREMAKLDETDVVARTLQARFERVRINVGKWDRHEGLRRSFDVRALATYIVLDPKTSRQLAKTTLEPISKKSQKLSAEEWARWLNEH
jgi:thiol:disulfide interchange protein